MPRFLRTTWLTILAGWAMPLLATAHEIGTTKVTAHLAESDYSIDVVVDPVSLLGRLESLAGRPRSGPLPIREYQPKIEALQQEFLSQVEIRFDGQRVPARFAYNAIAMPNAPPPDEQFGPAPAVIHLTGRVPGNAQVFTWKYPLTAASYALIAAHDGAKDSIEWLEGAQVSRAFVLATAAPPLSRARIAWTYFTLGFTHIVPKGLDHILFVLGLFLFSRQVRPMLLQVTAFTIAHSITLGLSIYGIVRLAPAVVEPLIAVSIAYVAIENIFTSRLKASRIALVFAFGLLHGMGFAGVLGDLGLPRSEFVTALVTFNVGVEAGQLAVITAAFLLVTHWTGHREWYRRRIVVPASVSIALVGVYWTVQRLL